jgi:UDP:flavonoid glycosyltransferase YjiC (YdhE family)
MARVLAYTSPARSHLYPLTPILDELHSRGHQIVLRTLDSQVGLMRARGFDAAAIDRRIEVIEHEDWRTRNPRESLRLNVRVFCARAEHDAPDLTHAIADVDPDVVLVDFNSWAAWSPPRRGVGRGLRSVPTRSRCARTMRRPTVRDLRPRVGHSVARATEW